MKEIFELLIYLNRDVQNIIEFLEKNQKTGLAQLKDQWVDSREVMEVLHISPRTLQSLRDHRKLPFSRVGAKLYYRLEDLERIFESSYNYKAPKIKRNGAR
jgi:hypothetical protein